MYVNVCRYSYIFSKKKNILKYIYNVFLKNLRVTAKFFIAIIVKIAQHQPSTWILRKKNQYK